MKNPWLEISLNDYESHMSDDNVYQQQEINKLFKSVYQKYKPGSLAIIGCSGGNGLEHVDTNITKRAVGIDINEEYLSALEARYGSRIKGLSIIKADVETDNISLEPVDLVFAVLIFEYVDVKKVLFRIKNLLKTNGILVAGLQKQNSESSVVSQTKYKNLRKLKSIMRLVDPLRFSRTCNGLGYHEKNTESIPLKNAKELFVGEYLLSSK